MAQAKREPRRPAGSGKAAYNAAKRTVPADTMWGFNKATAIFAVADAVLDARITARKKDLGQSITAGSGRWLRKLAYDEPDGWIPRARVTRGGAALRASPDDTGACSGRTGNTIRKIRERFIMPSSTMTDDRTCRSSSDVDFPKAGRAPTSISADGLLRRRRTARVSGSSHLVHRPPVVRFEDRFGRNGSCFTPAFPPQSASRRSSAQSDLPFEGPDAGR